MDLRNRIWYDLIRIKYQALYISNFSSYLRTLDSFFNVFIAICSSAAIASWIIWENHPEAWAIVLGIFQIINVSKPHLPYLKDKETLAQVKLLLEDLHLEYDQVWLTFDNADTDNWIHSKIYELKKIELDILKRINHLKVPSFKIIENNTRKDWAQFLLYNYNVNLNNYENESYDEHVEAETFATQA